ncbi:MAG: metallophosphoesterase family protein [Candidatus Micrarchaeia archaeon]
MVERFFFVTDLHGSCLAYNKAVNAGKFYNVKAIIIGGDLTGKSLVPVIETSTGYELEFQGKHFKVKKGHQGELEEIEKKIRETGAYYSVMEHSEYEDLAGNEKKLEEKFIEIMNNELGNFFDKAEEKLRQTGAKMYVIPGNDDYKEVAEFAKKYEGKQIIYFDSKLVDFGQYLLLGYGYSNPTPWHTPREKNEKEIYKDLKRLAEKAGEKGIYVIHAPPYDTELDKAPKLTKEMRQAMHETQHVGSTSVRRILEEYPPVLGLHGHIHESAGIDSILSKKGTKVPVINPGSEYNSGILRGAILELEQEKLAKYIFTEG